MAGRKRKPTRLHVVQGTAQPCRLNRDEPEAAPALPRPPATLGPRACEIFETLTERLDRMGLASETDTENLWLLAQTLEDIELANEEIRERGRAYAVIQLIEVTDEKGQAVTKAQKIWKSNPVVGQRAVAMRRAQSLLAEFGLSPASRPKVSAHHKKERGPNRWREIVNS